MNYEKPMVVILSERAQFAEGQRPQACISGLTESGTWKGCAVGGSAGWVCLVGTSGGLHGICVGGNSPGSDNDCSSGVGVIGGGYCVTGPDGYADTCTSGPAPTQ